MRGLTYSGSDGHVFRRSVHFPFFFKVPFGTFMDAFEDAHPTATATQILLKAHCQVFLDLVDHQEGNSSVISSDKTD